MRRSRTAATLDHIHAIDAAATGLSRNPHHTRQQHWQANHLHSVCCKLDGAEYAALLDCCARTGTTRYATLRALIISYTDAMMAL